METDPDTGPTAKFPPTRHSLTLNINIHMQFRQTGSKEKWEVPGLWSQKSLGWNPGYAIYCLCNPERFAWPLWVAVSWSVNRDDVTCANGQLLCPLRIRSPCSRKITLISSKSSRVLVSIMVACLSLDNQTLPPWNFKPEWGDPRMENGWSWFLLKMTSWRDCPSVPDARISWATRLLSFLGPGFSASSILWATPCSANRSCFCIS